MRQYRIISVVKKIFLPLSSPDRLTMLLVQSLGQSLKGKLRLRAIDTISVPMNKAQEKIFLYLTFEGGGGGVCTGTTNRLHVFNSKNKCQKEIIMAQKFYCKWCGTNYSSVSSLTSGHRSRNPEGKYHELYEGAEKSQYTCKFCGAKYSSLSSLTSGSCSKSPYKKHHPAL